jgi:alpha-tubulin suppressor-like RCC1 family protein
MKTLSFYFVLFFMSCHSFAQCYSTVVYAYDNIIARRTDGTLWARGRNSFGNGGNGTTGFLSQFVQVGTDNNWTDAIAANSSNVYAIKTDGTLWVWGDCGDARLLGLGNLGNLGAIIPTQVGTDNNWKSVATSPANGYGIKTNGTLWAWGSNYKGKLGIGSLDDDYIPNVPIQVGTDNNWKAIDANNIAVGIKTDGTLWSWGSDNVRLGYPNYNLNNSFRTPHQVGTASDWVSLSTVYGGFTAGLKTNGTL